MNIEPKLILMSIWASGNMRRKRNEKRGRQKRVCSKKKRSMHKNNFKKAHGVLKLVYFLRYDFYMAVVDLFCFLLDCWSFSMIIRINNLFSKYFVF